MENIAPEIGMGAYTLPDAAKILGLKLGNIRRWITKNQDGNNDALAGIMAAWGLGPERGINFNTLIELYTVAQLRDQGISMKRIRQARAELTNRFSTPYPFALRGILTDGDKILIELTEPDNDSVLLLDRRGQTKFKQIISGFCKRIDFGADSELAERYWPAGRSSRVVVDPRRAFGKPIVDGTSIPTEAIFQMYSAGEPKEYVADLYDLDISEVEDAIDFETRLAA